MLPLKRPHFTFPVFNFPPPVPFSQRLVTTTRRIFAQVPHPFSSPPPSPPSLRIVPVRGDGRCLYRAIAKNLANRDGRRLSENLERADADALRNIAWRAICVDRSKEFIAKHVIEGKFSTYCAQMRSPSFYGGEPEMLALADVLKIPIKVYLLLDRGQLKNIVTYGEQYASKKKRSSRRKASSSGAIRLLYANGNHYDALLPRTASLSDRRVATNK